MTENNHSEVTDSLTKFENGVLKKKAEDKAPTPAPAPRETWSGKLDFMMSALSFAVGMGNLWRFPYLCYRNGGGAFLIPYIIMVVMVGFPLVYLEFCLGQYGRKGIVSVWNAVPLFRGIGWGMWLLSIFVAVYYNMLIGWCFFYIFSSFQKEVPWKSCGNWWNTENCADTEDQMLRHNCSQSNGTYWNQTCFDQESSVYRQIVNGTLKLSAPRSPSDEYFHNYMLGVSAGLEDMGAPRWQLILCLMLVWIIIALCLSKGISSSGKASYVTAIFPYMMMSILFVRGLTLDGATEGIMYFITPQWAQLLSLKVWVDAAVQAFFSMSICWGGLITLASYNDFHSNAFRDAAVVAAGDSLTSIFGGVIIFSYLGYMAKQMGIEIGKVATQGPGLAFIVYPEAVTLLPVSQLWNILLMLVLVNVGLGTAFGIVQTVQHTLLDIMPSLKSGRRPLWLLLTICTLFFIAGIPLTTRGGIYILQLMDNYAASYAVLYFAILLTVTMGWIYGGKLSFTGMPAFSKNIEEMLGSKPSLFWVYSWKYICPILLTAILVFSLVDFTHASYLDYTIPLQYEVFGWFILLAEVSCVPVVAGLAIWKADHAMSLRQRIRFLCFPTSEWGPPNLPVQIQHTNQNGHANNNHQNGLTVKEMEMDSELTSLKISEEAKS